MTAFIAHDKLAKSLEKLTNVDLVALPITITVKSIVRARSDEGKRSLVRAVRFAEREIVHRGLQERTS
jgi:hypothetical protein